MHCWCKAGYLLWVALYSWSEYVICNTVLFGKKKECISRGGRVAGLLGYRVKVKHLDLWVIFGALLPPKYLTPKHALGMGS